MRFLHTADWHLGRSFHGASLIDAQAAWVDWLVDTARESRPDAVLVSGDVYDRALPPVDAVRLADDALKRLVEVAPVVMISGNHDSATRLGFGAGMFADAGLHLRTDVSQIGDPVVVGQAAIYGIPYLEPDVARPLLGVEARGHGPVMAAAMERVRADLATRPNVTRAVVLAHAFVAGGAESSSERDLAVGGAASIPGSIFAGVDYVALGHLHAPQRVGGRARYAGSPVAFSFSEAGHAKSVALVDLDGAVPAVELLPCPVARPLAVLRGELETLLADPALTGAEDAWVQVTLTDAARPAEAMERLRARFPHAVVLAFEPSGVVARSEESYAVRLRGLDDRELAAAFVEDVRGAGPSAAEQRLLDDALSAHRVAEAVS
ncbi:Nuclease SbcCD subunit D [Paraconexibacter sp. AEG42_29]|uniref:Nuclease SbcCD subunit D n=1 Tax=Paraconexibacter sp. AEG42_29 TaxID=2997339 RepID=A0AAU7AUK4_9ACTN